jgi:hypothetical protein
MGDGRNHRFHLSRVRQAEPSRDPGYRNLWTLQAIPDGSHSTNRPALARQHEPSRAGDLQLRAGHPSTYDKKMADRRSVSVPATLRKEFLLVFGLTLCVFLLTSAGFGASEGYPPQIRRASAMEAL